MLNEQLDCFNVTVDLRENVTVEMCGDAEIRWRWSFTAAIKSGVYPVPSSDRQFKSHPGTTQHMNRNTQARCSPHSIRNEIMAVLPLDAATCIGDKPE